MNDAMTLNFDLKNNITSSSHHGDQMYPGAFGFFDILYARHRHTDGRLGRQTTDNTITR
jgi:hypothetical protein